jgi:glycosyltransferase involved in cell wall biosynthesis
MTVATAAPHGNDRALVTAPCEARAPEVEVSFGFVSVVIPVYNELGTLEDLYAGLRATLPRVADDFEVLFVDDGSDDGSRELLERLAHRDARARVVSLRTNQGKAAALSVGFAEAKGEVIVTMDADLQDQPAEIPRLLAGLRDADLVSGWKRIRHDPLGKTIPSRIFNWVTSRVSGVCLHDFNCGFKAYRREVLAELDLYGELHRFIPVLAARRGFRCAEVEIEHAPRRWGRSKYGMGRLLKGALDLLTVVLLTRFETRPLHFFGTAGVVLGAAGLAVLSYLSYLRLVLDEVIGHRPLLFLGIVLLLSGIQLLSLGLVGELIHRRTRRGTPGLPLRAPAGRAAGA